MRLGAVIIASLCPAALCIAAPPDLAQIHTVYVMQMANGFDQYLVNWLAREGTFQVVTDPKKADAVFTDHLGESFEQTLTDWYAAPPPPKAAERTAEKQSDTATSETEKTEMPAAAPLRSSSFRRSKGTLFLVSPQSRAVVWSTFERPKRTSPEELNRTAERIVKRIQRDLNPRPSH